MLLSCCVVSLLFFFFKQKTAYEMRISDWSSDVCSSDLCDRPEMMRDSMLDGSDKQRRFGPEPGIERALGDAGGDRDPLHAGAFHAMGDELFERHIKNMNAQ